MKKQNVVLIQWHIIHPLKVMKIPGDLSEMVNQKAPGCCSPTQTKNKQQHMLKINFVRIQKPVKKLQQTNEHLTKSHT